MNNAQPKPPSYDNWRKEAKRRERRIVLTAFGVVFLLVGTLVFLTIYTVGQR